MLIDALSGLDEEEVLLMSQVNDVVGTIENKVEQLEELNIFSKYRAVYEKYNSFYGESKNIEAFKRIIFLQWYAVSEPGAFTGICGLNDVMQRNNLVTLQKMLTDGLLDKEFEAMLFHYYAISDWYFDTAADFSKISLIGNNVKSSNQIENYERRGQMGVYWTSLATSRV